MSESPAPTRFGFVFIVTVVVGSLMRVLGILLDQPALSWLALTCAVLGVAVIVALEVRRRRRMKTPSS